MKPFRIITGVAFIGVGIYLLLSIPFFFFSSHQNATKLLNEYHQTVVVKSTKGETPQKFPQKQLEQKVPDGIIGKITIKSVTLVAPIIEGTGDAVLAKGVGHLSTSVLPGENGTSILAAHNITFFHKIGHLKVNGIIQVDTNTGTKDFRIYNTKIVHTGDPVYQTKTPSLVLETCYPFNTIQLTPYRYLVFASEK